MQKKNTLFLLVTKEDGRLAFRGHDLYQVKKKNLFPPPPKLRKTTPPPPPIFVFDKNEHAAQTLVGHFLYFFIAARIINQCLTSQNLTFWK